MAEMVDSDKEKMLKNELASDMVPDAPPAMPSTALPDEAKISVYLDGLTAKAGELNPKLENCMVVAKPFIVLPIQVAMCVAPFYVWALKWAAITYHALPKNSIQAIFGLALCFFGGTYVASIAAIEAFRQMGFDKVVTELSVVYSQVKLVAKNNQADDVEDKDGDGIADVMQITPQELGQRKVFLAMRSIDDPKRLQNAIGALWASYIAVLATLRLEFARTTAFALGIVETVKYPLLRVLSTPTLMMLNAAPPSMRLSADAAKTWTSTIIESSLVFIAVIFAWYLQMIISAFYSALRGGKMFADGTITLLFENGYMKYVPFIAQPFNPDESFVDETVGYSIAACGFLFQFFSGFALPFPLNIIFLPLSIIEWFLRIQISMTANPAQ